MKYFDVAIFLCLFVFISSFSTAEVEKKDTLDELSETLDSIIVILEENPSLVDSIRTVYEDKVRENKEFKIDSLFSFDTTFVSLDTIELNNRHIRNWK
jgi:hypothetical protein